MWFLLFSATFLPSPPKGTTAALEAPLKSLTVPLHKCTFFRKVVRGGGGGGGEGSGENQRPTSQSAFVVVIVVVVKLSFIPVVCDS